MSFTSRLFSRWKGVRHKRRILPGVAALSVAIALKSQNVSDTKKDEVVFLTRAKNAIPSKADVQLHPSTLGEMRGPILPNGEVNMACACIEHGVIGPCGHEFRAMRVFIHAMDYSRDNLSEEKQEYFDKLLEAYFMCTMEHPVYYRSEMLPEEKEDLDRLQEINKLQEQKRLENWKKNFRRYGKDVVMFMPEDENKFPSTSNIVMTEVEEPRGPLLPNGDLNWACTCIEKDVVGPCNLEFRRFRKYIHDTKNVKFEDLSPEEQMAQGDELRQTVRSFLDCCKQHPVYYKRYLRSDDDDDNVDDNIEVDSE